MSLFAATSRPVAWYIPDGVLMGVLAFLDTTAAMRFRRCCRQYCKLSSSNRALQLWKTREIELPRQAPLLKWIEEQGLVYKDDEDEPGQQWRCGAAQQEKKTNTNTKKEKKKKAAAARGGLSRGGSKGSAIVIKTEYIKGLRFRIAYGDSSRHSLRRRCDYDDDIMQLSRLAYAEARQIVHLECEDGTYGYEELTTATALTQLYAPKFRLDKIEKKGWIKDCLPALRMLSVSNCDAKFPDHLEHLVLTDQELPLPIMSTLPPSLTHLEIHSSSIVDAFSSHHRSSGYAVSRPNTLCRLTGLQSLKLRRSNVAATVWLEAFSVSLPALTNLDIGHVAGISEQFIRDLPIAVPHLQRLVLRASTPNMVGVSPAWDKSLNQSLVALNTTVFPRLHSLEIHDVINLSLLEKLRNLAPVLRHLRVEDDAHKKAHQWQHLTTFTALTHLCIGTIGSEQRLRSQLNSGPLYADTCKLLLVHMARPSAAPFVFLNHILVVSNLAGALPALDQSVSTAASVATASAKISKLAPASSSSSSSSSSSASSAGLVSVSSPASAGSLSAPSSSSLHASSGLLRPSSLQTSVDHVVHKKPWSEAKMDSASTTLLASVLELLCSRALPRSAVQIEVCNSEPLVSQLASQMPLLRIFASTDRDIGAAVFV